MDEPTGKTRPRALTLKAYVALWVSCVLVSFLVLIGALSVARHRLGRMRDKMVADARALDDGRRLERSLLTAMNENLLYQVTGRHNHRTERDAAVRVAAEVAAGLMTEGVAASERRTVNDIHKQMRSFRALVAASWRSGADEVRSAAEGPLGLARRYIRKNEADMEEGMAAAMRLQAAVDYGITAAVICVAIMLAVGSVSLLGRVVRPTLDLTRAARRLGRGDLAARARVARADELGELARTFNSMAEDIADREKARLDFVAGVAHDLKNPLVVIGGAARHLRTCVLEPAHQAAWLDRIIRQVDRLENLIRDLMDTVQVSTGRLSLIKTPLDLTALVRGLHGEQAEHFPGHVLVFEGAEGCWVSADRDRIERVAINLISNAVKYSPEGSQVALRVAPHDAEAVLTVSDHGAGIAPEDLGVLFQPFGRGRQTRSLAGGSGLGLCIVRQILEAHGGQIRIESAVGGGTTVEVTLPLTSERPGYAGTPTTER